MEMRIKKMFIVILVMVSLVCAIIYYMSIDNSNEKESTLKIMTKENYKKFTPYDPLDKESYNKSLFGNNREYSTNYFKLQALYRKGLDDFLDNKFGLTILDKELDEKSSEIGVKIEQFDDVYKEYSTMGTKYIYLRNYVHVERLSDDELNFLLRRINMNNEEVDEELTNLISRTYKKVISYCLREGDDNYRELYDMRSGPYAKVRFDSLTIMVRVDTYASENFGQKTLEYFKELRSKIEKKGENITVIILISNGPIPGF